MVSPPIVAVVCAWCEALGRPQTAVRIPDSRRWRDVSHEHARALKCAGMASHGLCGDCREHLWQAWGLGNP